MRSQRPGSVRENGLRFNLTTLCLIGSGTCALAQQTVTVPPPTPSRGIVAANFIDPVGFGLVASHARPGGHRNSGQRALGPNRLHLGYFPRAKGCCNSSHPSTFNVSF